MYIYYIPPPPPPSQMYLHIYKFIHIHQNIHLIYKKGGWEKKKIYLEEGVRKKKGLGYRTLSFALTCAPALRRTCATAGCPLRAAQWRAVFELCCVCVLCGVFVCVCVYALT